MKRSISVLCLAVLGGAQLTGSAQCLLEEEATVVAYDAETVAQPGFGSSVSIGGGTLAVGRFPGDAVYAYDFDAMLASRPAASVLASVASRRGPAAYEQKLEASDIASGISFGSSVAADGDVVVVGARAWSGSRGKVYVFTLQPSGWQESQHLSPSVPLPKSYFGQSVAVSGDVLAIGAPDDFGSLGGPPGRVFVFRRTAGLWQEEALLVATDAATDDGFGYALALQDDTLLVGTKHRGAAYVFRHDGVGWNEEQKLSPPFSPSAGETVALDHDVAVLGAQQRDNWPIQQCGGAFVFRYASPQWTLEQTLLASDRQPFDLFGSSVAVRDDTIVVGAAFDDDGSDLPTIDKFCQSGAAYVFRFNGATWQEEYKVLASDGACGNRFGFSVAMDSDWAVIGGLHPDQFVYLVDVTPPEYPVTLDVLPYDVRVGGTVQFSACRGVSFSPALLSVSAVGGVPFFRPIPPAATFDLNGMWELSGQLSTTFGSLEVDFMLLGLGTGGELATSNPARVLLQ
jgi:hypothetical protein